MEIAAWRRAILVFAAMLFGATSCALAQEWATAMFDATSHDFGTVARGTKVEHHFVIQNRYAENAHIKSVSSSCGCSTLEASRQLIKPREKTELPVVLDTHGAMGRKEATITVVLDQPFPAEVQLHIRAFIRSDTLVEPEEVCFGCVQQGAQAEQCVSISHTGRSDWRIERVECANPHVEAQVEETGRTATESEQTAQVHYRLTATLKSDASLGYIRDQIVLVTNDKNARAAQVPIVVGGLVTTALSVRPDRLLMNPANSHGPVTRNLVIQGQTPFRILAAQACDKRFQCQVPSDKKMVHILPITFLGTKTNSPAGSNHTKVRIETDLVEAHVVEVEVSVQDEPATSHRP